MIGVLMFFAPLIISLIRGTPRVTFILATPAKWNVLSVICVPGSPMDCAPTAPTVEPAADRPAIVQLHTTTFVEKGMLPVYMASNARNVQHAADTGKVQTPARTSWADVDHLLRNRELMHINMRSPPSEPHAPD